MAALVVSLLAGVAAALPATTSQAPAIPIHYKYGGYPRIETDITWGTPAQKYVPTIFDTGSSGFWVFGPNATINDGSSSHFNQGPCNKTVTNFYNWPASSTHSKVNTSYTYGFSYGGNGKLITAPSAINDTFSFTNKKWPALTNNLVALANFALVTQLDQHCKVPESSFDHSIMGLAPYTNISGGPSFRGDLLSQGKTQSSTFSMWHDKAPKSVKGTFQGTALFGAVPSNSKYSGELVRLKQNPPRTPYVGYYVSTPKLTATSITKPGSPSTISQSDKSVKQCLLDSGTGQDLLPFSEKELFQVTGLVQYSDQSPFVVWNGTCESIPASATLNYTFTGATAGKTVTVAVPIRNYARGIYDGITGNKVCSLSMSLSEIGDCVFGAPFFTAAFAVFDDDNKQVALAQGGVSTGATAGPSGLGSVTTIAKGQNIPGSV